MNQALFLTGSKLVGYKDVEWENFTPAGFTYYVPVVNVHFYIEYYEGIWLYRKNGSDLFRDPAYDGRGWISSNTPTSTYVSSNTSYPFGNLWGRTYSPEIWNPSGNQGFKTLSEWESLEQDVINGTKRNLTGVNVFK